MRKRIGYLFILMMLICIALAIKIYLPNFSTISIYEVFHQYKQGTINVTIQNEPIEVQNHPQIVEGEIFLPVDFVNQYIDHTIFWDEKEKRLTITTQNQLIRMKTDELTYYINQNPAEIEIPVQLFDEVPYIPYTLLKEWYDIELLYSQESNIVMMDYLTHHKQIGKLGKNVSIRTQPDHKSPIVGHAAEGETVILYDEVLPWVQVRTEAGIVGYMKKKAIASTESISPKPMEEQEELPVKNPIQGKINLVWDQLFYASANRNINSYPPMEGMNVISPTWFQIKSNTGDISSIADKGYVDSAHRRGYQVWALFNNPFSDPEMTHAALSSTESREKMIKQLLAYAALYDLDGINIDFESIPKKTE